MSDKLNRIKTINEQRNYEGNRSNSFVVSIVSADVLLESVDLYAQWWLYPIPVYPWDR